MLKVWFQNARAKWRRNLMRQEGSQTGSTPTNQGTNGQSSVGVTGIIGDSNHLPHQNTLDDIHHHIHSQNSQSLNFGEIY